jgi:hypothetical protein
MMGFKRNKYERLRLAFGKDDDRRKMADELIMRAELLEHNLDKAAMLAEMWVFDAMELPQDHVCSDHPGVNICREMGKLADAIRDLDVE